MSPLCIPVCVVTDGQRGSSISAATPGAVSGIVSQPVLGMAIGTTSLSRELPNVLQILDDLPKPTTSSAFGRTVHAVVDWRGQIVTMLDRCHLTQAIPVQIISA
ncbi:hypothetical protein [Mycobacterium lepromatosis]|uniref:hypothetical protein n=1 Tax=Mycobacterium lepromatosis TaxID=480418 RepID=UPI0026A9B1B6